jgi:threonine dehydrogenase-like Zn-dependent dehydrogenase
MKPGDTVAVIGAGTIGLGVIAAAKALGAGQVIASAKYAHQAKLAEVLGAAIVTGTNGGELEAAVKAATHGLGADLAVETIGGSQAATLEQAIHVCRTQGTVSVAGLASSGTLPFDLRAPLRAELSLVFSFGYGVVDGHHDVEAAIDLLTSGRVHLGRAVTHTYSLEDFQKAFDTASDKRTGAVKVQIAQR